MWKKCGCSRIVLAFIRGILIATVNEKVMASKYSKMVISMKENGSVIWQTAKENFGTLTVTIMRVYGLMTRRMVKVYILQQMGQVT